MNTLSTHELLTLEKTAKWHSGKQDIVSELAKQFNVWRLQKDSPDLTDRQFWKVFQLTQYLLWQTNTWLEEIKDQRHHYYEFVRASSNAPSDVEKMEHIQTITTLLGYSDLARKRIQQKQAEWFDEHAIYDCFIRRQSEQESNVVFCLEKLEQLTAYLLINYAGMLTKNMWQALDMANSLQIPLHYPVNAHIPQATIKCLRISYQLLPEDIKEPLPINIQQFIYRVSLDSGINTWVRCEAASLIFQLLPEQVDTFTTQIFPGTHATDIFLKGRITRLICQWHKQLTDIQQLTTCIAEDSADYVRQQLAQHCHHLPDAISLTLLKKLTTDSVSQVAASAWQALVKAPSRTLQQPAAFELLVQGLHIAPSATSTLACKTILNELKTLFSACTEASTPSFSPAQLEQLTTLLTTLNLSHPDLAIRRAAASTREALWFSNHYQQLSPQTRQQLKALILNNACTITPDSQLAEESLYRLMMNLGNQRFGFDIVAKPPIFSSKSRKTLRITAGFTFTFRFWRFLHEFFHPATDKRQHHNHVKGRTWFGLIHTATERMAERTQTRVPGEPVYQENEQGWRCFLPLLDQVISSLDQGWPTQPVQIYSPEGITEIHPPSGLFSRIKARLILQYRFEKIARLRNWNSGQNFPASAYLDELRKLGFSFSIKGHKRDDATRHPVDHQVTQFFSATPLPFALPSWDELQNYFYSVYQNSIQQLVAFTAIVFIGFTGYHARLLMKLKQARQQIPLVIGGWGTRGKSGTERLKAALFNALGVSVLSKTTGCEAMFLYGPANQPTKELFLFRPYDKATIWEQVFLTRLASKMNVDVFLWECMGLTPRYIDILQNQWMKDDYSTITNCYPDHEDLQGPAGYDIPTVMQRFIPKHSTVITSEDTMLPLLQDAAMQQQTQLIPVNTLDADLLTADVLARFPYEEHPVNIALVLKLAETLGIEKDFALKEMADNVVADLGVLKIYPTTTIEQRHIQFINGMSANERLATVGNWQRTRLHEANLTDTPNIWLTVIINNRADRIARSKVFASMIINDLHADQYVFIGNNLDGFVRYIDDAWAAFTEKLSSTDNEGKTIALSRERFEALANTFRIPVTAQHVNNRLDACLDGITIEQHADNPLCVSRPMLTSITEADLTELKLFNDPYSDNEILQAVQQHIVNDIRHYLQFQQLVDETTAPFDSNAAISWLYQVFRSRWVIIDNYHASGNQTINTLVQHTPPGLTCKTLGVQNIKGTGLDFVYRWQAWDSLHKHCQVLMESRNDHQIELSAKALAGWEEYGLLDEQLVIRMLSVAKSRKETQKELIQAELHLAEHRMKQQLLDVRQALTMNPGASGLLSRIIAGVEAFIDAGDAVRRRKRADAIYEALNQHLISYDKASVELSALTREQKGGWLEKKLRKQFK